MRTRYCLVLVAGLWLTGCDQKSNTAEPGGTNATKEGSVVSAPTDYLKAVTKGELSAEKTADTASLNKAVDMFNVDKGRYPKDLNELVQEKYIPKLPTPPYGTKLDYNPTSGKVSVVQQ
jgi:hypothetical protein